ncbi:hypothetical protein [Staphylococcus pseudintermedius]|uniref:hypothetical protein n=1 Tax=Staphylococcus pseudintermedius TaxID=283734 RepID=UPI0013EF7C8B|nr:hypothetical protein [Staphylococcus pseudintermedius]
MQGICITVDSLKDKASNNGTPSEFASAVKSTHASVRNVSIRKYISINIDK